MEATTIRLAKRSVEVKRLTTFKNTVFVLTDQGRDLGIQAQRGADRIRAAAEEYNHPYTDAASRIRISLLFRRLKERTGLAFTTLAVPDDQSREVSRRLEEMFARLIRW